MLRIYSRVPTLVIMMAKPKGERKTLIQLQSEVVNKDPASQAAQTVLEVDKFARSLAKKKLAASEQIAADKKELAYVESSLASEKLKYKALLETLEERKAEHTRIHTHLSNCQEMSDSLVDRSKATFASARREDNKMQKAAASLSLRTARGFDTGVESTFTRKMMRQQLLSSAKGSTMNSTTGSR